MEAKGATSSKPGSARYGKEFDSNQIKTHIGVALVKSFQTLQKYPDSDVIVALPHNRGHRSLIDGMAVPIRNSGVKVVFVENDGHVVEFI